MQAHFAGIMLVRSCTKMPHFVLIQQKKWPKLSYFWTVYTLKFLYSEITKPITTTQSNVCEIPNFVLISKTWLLWTILSINWLIFKNIILLQSYTFTQCLHNKASYLILFPRKNMAAMRILVSETIQLFEPKQHVQPDPDPVEHLVIN